MPKKLRIPDQVYKKNCNVKCSLEPVQPKAELNKFTRIRSQSKIRSNKCFSEKATNER